MIELLDLINSLNLLALFFVVGQTAQPTTQSTTVKNNRKDEIKIKAVKDILNILKTALTNKKGGYLKIKSDAITTTNNNNPFKDLNLDQDLFNAKKKINNTLIQGLETKFNSYNNDQKVKFFDMLSLIESINDIGMFYSNIPMSYQDDLVSENRKVVDRIADVFATAETQIMDIAKEKTAPNGQNKTLDSSISSPEPQLPSAPPQEKVILEKINKIEITHIEAKNLLSTYYEHNQNSLLNTPSIKSLSTILTEIIRDIKENAHTSLYNKAAFGKRTDYELDELIKDLCMKDKSSYGLELTQAYKNEIETPLNKQREAIRNGFQTLITDNIDALTSKNSDNQDEAFENLTAGGIIANYDKATEQYQFSYKYNNNGRVLTINLHEFLFENIEKEKSNRWKNALEANGKNFVTNVKPSRYNALSVKALECSKQNIGIIFSDSSEEIKMGSFILVHDYLFGKFKLSNKDFTFDEDFKDIITIAKHEYNNLKYGEASVDEYKQGCRAIVAGQFNSDDTNNVYYQKITKIKDKNKNFNFNPKF